MTRTLYVLADWRRDGCYYGFEWLTTGRALGFVWLSVN